MAILVTGGTGYIGSHTVVELISSGNDVVIVDNLSNSKLCVLDRIEKITGRKPDFFKVDLLDYNSLDNVFSRYKFDAVIHFAGLKAVGESVSLPLKYYHNNLTGTFNLLNCMIENKVNNIVFSSSATVYGVPKSVPIKEDYPRSATKPGGETAAEAGTILTAGKQGLEIACGDGRSLWITELQAEGGKRMAAADYLRGHPVEVGK